MKFFDKIDVLVAIACEVVASSHVNGTVTKEVEELRKAILDFEINGLNHWSQVKLTEAKKAGKVEDTLDISEEAELICNPLCVIGQGSYTRPANTIGELF